MTGPELAAARRRLGLTQAELARELGITVGTLSTWERGLYQPQHLELVRRALAHLESERRLPTVAEIGGSDPDFTGEISTHDYVHRVRGKPMPKNR